MLERGYMVAATDYPGLGARSSLSGGESEARAVLDSVRAARSIPEAAPERISPYGAIRRAGRRRCSLVSSGALCAGTEARRRRRGCAGDRLAALMSDDLGTGGGNNITAMTLWSWARVYGAPMDKVVTPQAEPVIDRLTKLCIERWFDVLTRRGPTQALEKSFLRVGNPADQEPWRRLLEENSPGSCPRTSQFSSRKDRPTVSCGPVTEAYRERLCETEFGWSLFSWPAVGHAFIARDVAQAAVAWMAGRFAGEPAPTNCGT